MNENTVKERAPVIPLKRDRNEIATGPRKPPPHDAVLLLRSGGGAIATGLLFLLLARTVFGGIGPQGPHTNAGWLSLIVTMMCLPFGSMLFALGAAKWLKNRL